MDERIKEIRLHFEVGSKEIYEEAAENTATLLAEIDRLTESANRADVLREAASSALCLLTEGPEVVGTRQAVDDARKVLSEALQASKHPQGTYRLTSIQRTLLERRGWQGQDPVPWLLKQIERDDLGGEE